jgi:hypothetical protein
VLLRVLISAQRKFRQAKKCFLQLDKNRGKDYWLVFPNHAWGELHIKFWWESQKEKAH